MTTTEHIVETYYRVAKNCLTLTDFKVVGGNNRQLDVLAYNPSESSFRHIEVGVTHNEKWTANLESVKNDIGFKFFGHPRNNRPDNQNTDFKKGKTYTEQIKKAYATFGIDWDKVIRVWCLWRYTETEEEIKKWKGDLEKEFGIKADRFELLSFRDTVIPGLYDNIGTANYSDEIMRTISLMKEYDRQTRNKKH
jgi:hypothetical protein